MSRHVAFTGFLISAIICSAAERELRPDEKWVYVKVNLIDTHGKPVTVPSAKARANSFPHRRRYLDGDLFLHDNGAPEGTLAGKFPVDFRDELEAFVVTLENIRGYTNIQLAPRRFYRDGAGPNEHRGLGVKGNPYVLSAIAVRDPGQWRPVFDSYEKLPERLRGLLAVSKKVEFLPLKGSPECIDPKKTSTDCDGILDKQNFESPAIKNEEEFSLAKATLLNIYTLLDATLVPTAVSPEHGEKWFDSLLEIRRIGQERIIAKVKPQMFFRVRRLVDEFTDPFNCEGYYSASPALHSRNLVNLHLGGIEVVSVKAPSCKGNLQLTVARFSQSDAESYFADIDIDQNRALPHVFDALIQTAAHKGTSPVLIYEELGALPAFRQLNYHLEPKVR
jgi:hypothetical protein